MNSQSITHVGFSDESNWNTGRFRSLGLVTVLVDALEDLNNELKGLLTESGISEFKWEKLRQARERIGAQKMCEFTIKHALDRRLRVDILIWDIQDSRHDIPGRDDIANLQRMYYHLFRNVLRSRWPHGAVWRLHPDEHTAMDWSTVQDCLENVADRLEIERSLFNEGQFRVRLRRDFGLEEIRSALSHEQPLLQLADLFAGMAVFSRTQFDAYQAWLTAKSPQSGLFDDQNEAPDASRSSSERFSVLQHLDARCKKHKLGVSLKRKQGLWTPDPQRPINFWIYEAQHPEDKAPQKRKE
ncbi:DUF3800 domain-containing protein [Meiothermus sp.]|uniref:DUF3800 domain-containing protein n=1 Tax=Meiothermus sp. TaxID=1955249 RepID=UPI0021DB9865|nr:DUF3800 domain-containing protein [Meiothermus sp.]GIW33850.1 MAG: hypothetical protein KatS3mg072_1183 [Meiothermus sp.]